MSRAYEDALEERAVIRHAAAFGITRNEIDRVIYEENVDESDEGVPYGIIITFDMDNSDAAVLAKISGIGANGTLRLGINAFYDYDESRK
jgi:hypothetical protein